MKPVRLLSVAEQTAAHLREGLIGGRWEKQLPGVVRLATECDVSTGVMRAALNQLEAEGLISGRGLGRCRSICTPASILPAKLRVGILRHDARLTDNPQTSAVLTEIQHSLESAGHSTFHASKSQVELKHDFQKMTRQLAKTPADAWVVEAGSHPLLKWCSTQETPYLSLYGSTYQLPLASTGPRLLPAYRAAFRQLLGLGHRRIVFVLSGARRKPILGISARAFLEEMNAHGVQTSSYNLPDWEETPEGFHRMLDILFQHTPPTALLIDETPRFIAAVSYLARRGIQVPEQVSLVSSDCDAFLNWCQPTYAHMGWDSEPVVRRVVRWVNAVRRGKPDRKEILFPAEFSPGGSIGPVWKG